MVVAGRNVEAAEKAAEEIARETRVSALAAPADVSVPEQCEKLIAEAVAHFGAVDVLVNNAAYFALVPLLDAEPEIANRFLGANLLGPLNCARALARWAIEAKRRATIVNVSSIAGAQPAPGCGLYSASKAALDMLTQSMALEWTAKGVRVNGVARPCDDPGGPGRFRRRPARPRGDGRPHPRWPNCRCGGHRRCRAVPQR